MNGLVLPDRCFSTHHSPSSHREEGYRNCLFGHSLLQVFSAQPWWIRSLEKHSPCQTFLGYGFSQYVSSHSVPFQELDFLVWGELLKCRRPQDWAGVSQLPVLREPRHQDPRHPGPGITSVRKQRQAQAALSSHSLEIGRTPRPDNQLMKDRMLTGPDALFTQALNIWKNKTLYGPFSKSLGDIDLKQINMGLHPRSTKSESLGVIQEICVFTKLSNKFWCLLRVWGIPDSQVPSLSRTFRGRTSI